MKSNLKSGNAIVRLLLAHGEKAGILAILVCTALIVYSAIGRERLEHEPSQLKSLAGDARTRVTSYEWKDLPLDGGKLTAEPLPEVAKSKLNPGDFPIYDRLLNDPITEPVKLRLDPVLLAPTQLEAQGDAGLWTSSSPETIQQRQLEEAKKRAEEAAERAAEMARTENDPRNRGGRGAGGLGRDGGYGAQAGRGGRNNRVSRDAPIIERPTSGARVQGFEDVTARSWVTVLAAVPIEQQNELYKDALENARGFSEMTDTPAYLGYQVERAEVTPLGQGEWKALPLINARKILDEIKTYPVNVPDVIDPDVNHPILTHPLPPLILREWGDRVSHSSMPLAIEKARMEAEERNQPDETEESEEELGEDDPFAEPEFERGGRGGGFAGRGEEYGGFGGRGGEYGGRGGEYGGYGEYGGRGGEYGGMEGGFGGRGGEYGGFGGRGGEFGGRGGEYGGSYGTMGRGAGATLATFVWDRETPHVLLRYFDNDVTPGHSYRYRIRLSVRDVNHKVRPQNLDKTVSTRREAEGNKNYRWTDWSEPSPIASVPMPARIYVMSSEPARETNFNSEPEAEILIKALDEKFAAEVGRTDSFSRGSVLNIFDKAKVIWVDRYEEEETPSFRFLTGITVLDVDGGEKLEVSRDMQAPARALLMDASGQLFLQSEMDDEETVKEYEQIIEFSKDPRNRGGRGGGRGGERGGFGGEGEMRGGEYGGYGEGR